MTIVATKNHSGFVFISYYFNMHQTRIEMSSQSGLGISNFDAILTLNYMLFECQIISNRYTLCEKESTKIYVFFNSLKNYSLSPFKLVYFLFFLQFQSSNPFSFAHLLTNSYINVKKKY